MNRDREHSYIPTLKEQLAEGKIDRREFLRTSSLLGLSAGAAYAFAGKFCEQGWVAPARAEMPKGGNLAIGVRVQEIQDPHAISWVEGSNMVRQVCDYLTRTGEDNLTRPSLAESWEASEDLKTWTFKLRR